MKNVQKNQKIENDIRQALNSCHLVKGMLETVPRDCAFLFIPGSIEELRSMEERAMRLKDIENRRNEVMFLQRKYDLPLRPNWSLRETKIRIRIAQRKKVLHNWGKNRPDNDRNW